MYRSAVHPCIVALVCLCGAVAVWSQTQSKPEPEASAPTPDHVGNGARVPLAESCFDNPTLYKRSMAVSLESVFTEAVAEALAKRDGVTAAVLFDFRTGVAAERAALDVREQASLDALRAGLAGALHPVAAVPRDAPAGCPLMFEAAVRTSAGEVRIWGTCVGFTVVPGAVKGKCFFSKPLAEAISSILRASGRPEVQPEVLAMLSGTRDGPLALPPRGRAAAGPRRADPGVLSEIRIAEAELGKDVFWLRSTRTGERHGSYSVWNGTEWEIGGERYKVEVEAPQSVNERLSRLILPHFDGYGLDLEQLADHLHTRSIELDPWLMGVRFVLLPAKSKARGGYAREPPKSPVMVDGCSLKHLLTHIEDAYRVRCIVQDDAVAICPAEDATPEDP